MEWQKLRDEKIKLKRKEMEAEEDRSRLNKSQTRSKLPRDYKGPVSGYYQNV